MSTTYANGSGGWCGCNCNCCPPQPLYSQVTVVFDVGTPSTEWEGPSMMAPLPGMVSAQSGNEGCVCPGVGLRARNLPKLGAMPDFEQEEKDLGSEDGRFVFALSAGGCIPCQQVIVTLSTTGLGFWLNDNNIYMVGNGTVTAVAVPDYITGCGDLIPYVNGDEYTYEGSDGDSLAVTLINTDSTYDCQVCTQPEGITGTNTIVAMTKAAIMQRQRNIRRSTILSKQAALRQKIRQVTSPRSKPISEPRP